MRTFFKYLTFLILILGVIVSLYLAFLYYVPYSEGVRSGELIKFSKKGFIIKTWEGEISQGISGAQIFQFSVYRSNQKVIDDLNNFQGNYVKLHYEEHYGNFFYWGQSKYFVTAVEEDQSPFGGRQP